MAEHTIYCYYKRLTVRASECERCERKADCPSMGGW